MTDEKKIEDQAPTELKDEALDDASGGIIAILIGKTAPTVKISDGTSNISDGTSN